MSFYKNTLWSFLSIIGAQLINVLTNMVLARLLAPEYFGILGMAMVFAGVIFVIQESGFSSYLIYKKNHNIKVISSTFWLNFTVSICLALLLWILSPHISILYNNNQVGIVLKYVSVGILLGSLGNTSRAILMKNNKFKIIAKVDICAELVSSSLAIYFAVYDDPLLAVSTKYLVRPLIQALLSIISQPITINVPFKLDRRETRNIISYSSNVLGSQLFMYANNNIDYFLVGKILGNVQLGYYSLAFQWGSIARYYISNAIIRVMFPEASKLQNDLLKVKSVFLEVVSKVSLISLPLCIGFSLISYEFISIFYGEKWIDVVPVLQLLLLAGGIASITIVGGSILRGIGNPRAEMKTSILSFCFFGLLLIAFTKFGLIAVAFCELLRVIVVESFRLYLLKKSLNIKYREVFMKIIPNLISVSAMVLVISIFNLFELFSSAFINLILKIIIGITAYIVTTYFINRKEIEGLLIKFKMKGT